MYKNRISRTAPTTTSNRHPHFFIRRYECVFGPEAAYVESFCATLIENRFGMGRLMPVIVVLRDRPELEPAAFYDLSDNNEIAPCYTLSPLPSLRRRKGYQVVEAAYRRAKQMRFVAAASHRSSLTSGCSSNLGRGSP